MDDATITQSFNEMAKEIKENNNHSNLISKTLNELQDRASKIEESMGELYNNMYDRVSELENSGQQNINDYVEQRLRDLYHKIISQPLLEYSNLNEMAKEIKANNYHSNHIAECLGELQDRVSELEGKTESMIGRGESEYIRLKSAEMRLFKRVEELENASKPTFVQTLLKEEEKSEEDRAKEYRRNRQEIDKKEYISLLDKVKDGVYDLDKNGDPVEPKEDYRVAFELGKGQGKEDAEALDKFLKENKMVLQEPKEDYAPNPLDFVSDDQKEEYLEKMKCEKQTEVIYTRKHESILFELDPLIELAKLQKWEKGKESSKDVRSSLEIDIKANEFGSNAPYSVSIEDPNNIWNHKGKVVFGEPEFKGIDQMHDEKEPSQVQEVLKEKQTTLRAGKINKILTKRITTILTYSVIVELAAEIAKSLEEG